MKTWLTKALELLTASLEPPSDLRESMPLKSAENSQANCRGR